MVHDLRSGPRRTRCGLGPDGGRTARLAVAGGSSREHRGLVHRNKFPIAVPEEHYRLWQLAAGGDHVGGGGVEGEPPATPGVDGAVSPQLGAARAARAHRDAALHRGPVNLRRHLRTGASPRESVPPTDEAGAGIGNDARHWHVCHCSSNLRCSRWCVHGRALASNYDHHHAGCRGQRRSPA